MGGREELYKDLLAKKFWSAWAEQWKQHKFYMTYLVIKNKCIIVSKRYNEFKEAQSKCLPLWFLKSFLKGISIKFLCALALCMIVSELPFVWKLIKCGFNFRSNELIEPLFSALPALLGMSFLDYILEGKGISNSVLIPAMLAFLVLAGCGYYFGNVEPNLDGSYIVTGLTILMSWCIKTQDSRMIENNQGHPPSFGDQDTSTLKTKTYFSNGKKITLER